MSRPARCHQLESPENASRGPEYEVGQCVGIGFVVIEVERLEEPGGAIFSSLGTEGIPERGDA
jgi:hypothetical protein